MRVVKAAAVQLSPVLYSRNGTVDKVVQTIHELGDGPRHGHVNTRPSQSQPQLCPCESGRV